MQNVKSFVISRHLVMQAWMRVKSNRGSAGIDGQSITEFEIKLKSNLYCIWNRMSSGSYMPQAVKLVEIPKRNGATRPLGIPTVSDRIAQMVVVLMLEPELEPHFHADSYGFRPNRSAHDALRTARKRCWEYDWVLDMDIKGFFDNIDHKKLLLALRKHTSSRWIRLYVERWLLVPYETTKGERIERNKGVPQGSVIGPLLSNLFLHYAFDEWMRRSYPEIPFERYADDIICHLRSGEEAERIRAIIQKRLTECNLELNESKTKVVYCKDSNRKRNEDQIQFDFLGFTFRPRSAKNHRGEYFCSFLPAISNKAKRKIGQTMRAWWTTSRTDIELPELAKRINRQIQGWINYYGKFYPSALTVLFKRLNARLTIWVTKKYKRFKARRTRAGKWLFSFYKIYPRLFAHWKSGYIPVNPIRIVTG
jgi:RNA-directed DNA polymerase